MATPELEGEMMRGSLSCGLSPVVYVSLLWLWTREEAHVQVARWLFEKSSRCRGDLTTIELKKEIIAKYESGVRVSDLASQYEMAKSTISTILKHKEVLEKADVAIGVTAISKQRPQIMEEMEKKWNPSHE
ncbi:DNA binding HTH domain Psq-type [Trinorchestia longiramus]|nr:DNA binding HTH domain Psq-type [Trinorchestia longiramus]